MLNIKILRKEKYNTIIFSFDDNYIIREIELNAKKWVISFLSLSIAIIFIMCSVTYFYDPFCYYRIPENRFIVNNYRFLNAGIAKNADYDTVIIGSSMTQNFNMDSFRKKLNVNPIKLTVGAMSIEGMELTYNQVKDIGKAKKIFLCIDVPSLNKEEDNLESYATYLYNKTILDDFKYLMGYETWARLLPLNILFDTGDKLGINLPDFYGSKTIDNIGEWHSQAVYGKDVVMKQYLSNNIGLSKQNTVGVYGRMKKNADHIIDLVCKDGQDTVLFFPPYSALFWYNSMESQMFEEYTKIKSYIVNKVDGMSNVAVYDFQPFSQICDLDNYKDITHYSAKINEYMVDCFANKQYIVTSETIDDSNNILREMVEIFKNDNSSWLR